MRIKAIINNFSNNNRIRKYKLFIDYFKPSPESRILDIGASEREYQEGANILEKQYAYSEPTRVPQPGRRGTPEGPKWSASRSRYASATLRMVGA